MLKLVLLSALTTVSFGVRIPSAKGELEEYIIGGNEIDISKVPYQVAQYRYKLMGCGGAIVSPTIIVTAAHCVRDHLVSEMSFRAGSHVHNSGGVLVQAKNYWMHPDYNRTTLEYDIAVVEIKTALKFSKTIQPIPLATSEPPDKTEALVSGWGAIEENGDRVLTLRSVVIPIVERKTCQKLIQKYNITSSMICAGVEGKDSCHGDSGGPLNVGGRLVGLVSFGIGCGRKDLPGVYVNVADPKVQAFIKKYAKL